jgi:hypothetical protein
MFIIPSKLSAQHEYNGAMINVEYGGRAAERPEPGGRGGSDRDSRGNNQGTSKPTSSTQPSERKSKVTINGETFSVTTDTEKRLSEFITTYKTNGNVGSFVSAVASIFSLFDLFNLETSYPSIDAVFKLSTFNSEEVITKLAAPNIWNRAWRSQAASYCESEWFTALSKGKNKDAQMWLRIRDIISNPERYKGGGIKYNNKENKVIFRSYPAEAYRSIAGFELDLTDMDINQLGYLTSYLMYFPQSRDYLIYADYIYDLKKPKTEFKQITARDKMILNYALLGLNQNAKLYLDNVFVINSTHPNQTYQFWSTLKKYLYQDVWSNGRVPDVDTDQLGFYNDEPFNNSDLVTGQYPTTSIFTVPLPVNWNIPIQQKKQVYQFYYHGR